MTDKSKTWQITNKVEKDIEEMIWQPARWIREEILPNCPDMAKIMFKRLDRLLTIAFWQYCAKNDDSADFCEAYYFKPNGNPYNHPRQPNGSNNNNDNNNDNENDNNDNENEPKTTVQIQTTTMYTEMCYSRADCTRMEPDMCPDKSDCNCNDGECVPRTTTTSTTEYPTTTTTTQYPTTTTTDYPTTTTDYPTTTTTEYPTTTSDYTTTKTTTTTAYTTTEYVTTTGAVTTTTEYMWKCTDEQRQSYKIINFSEFHFHIDNIKNIVFFLF